MPGDVLAQLQAAELVPTALCLQPYTAHADALRIHPQRAAGRNRNHGERKDGKEQGGNTHDKARSQVGPAVEE